MAIDGKVLRRSFDSASGKSPLHMVSAWGCEQRLVLAQIATDAKSNEITAVPKLLAMLRLNGTIVTTDALNCQRAIARPIVGGEDAVALALVDDVLGVAQEMGEAGLLVFRSPASLGAVAIGDPHLRPNVAEELFDRLLGAAGMGQKAGIFAVVENPQPPASLADPQAGFVGADHSP